MNNPRPLQSIWNQKSMESQQDMPWINERYTYTSIWASGSASRDFSQVGCHMPISKYFTRWPGKDTPCYSGPEIEDTFYENEHVISDIMHLIDIIDIRHIPKDGRIRFYPVLAAALGGEKNHRRAVPFMRWKAFIKTSHIRRCIVDIGIVMVGRVKWTRLGIFIFARGGRPDLLSLFLTWLAT